jgi:hypothetical protein
MLATEGDRGKAAVVHHYMQKLVEKLEDMFNEFV